MAAEGEKGAMEVEEAVAAPSDKGKGVAEAGAEAVDREKMVVVRSADGAERCMSPAAAELSPHIRDFWIEAPSNFIPLPNIHTGRILDLVIEYCTKHAAGPAVKLDSDPSGAATTSSSSRVGAVNTAGDLKAWDRKFVERVSMDDLHELLLAANYLNIKGLLEVICQKAADMIKGKTTQQIRDTFNLPNDNTPEDEAELRREYAWAFDV